MSSNSHDRAPGDDMPIHTGGETFSELLVYTTGFVLAIVLSAISFWAGPYRMVACRVRV